MASVYAIYILLPDGRCIYSKSYRNDSTDSQVLGGLLTSLNFASQQYLHESIRKFVSEGGSNFVIKDFSSFLTVFQVGGEISQDIEAKVDLIGFRFLSNYGDMIEKWSQGKISRFKSFDKDVDNILGIKGYVDTEKPLIPTSFNNELEEKVLDSLSIMVLSRPLQKTALAMLDLKEGTTEEIARETKNNIQNEEKNLETLVHMGYIQSRKYNNMKIYYIS